MLQQMQFFLFGEKMFHIELTGRSTELEIYGLFPQIKEI